MQKKFTKINLIISIIVLLGITITNFIRFYIYGIVGVVIWMVIHIILYTLLLSLSIYSILYFIRKNISCILIISFLLNIITILIILFLPFDKINLLYNFYSKLNGRTQITEKIIDNKLRGNEYGIYKLPLEYSNLSVNGNEVIIANDGEDLVIFFFTSRPIIDGAEGFGYVIKGKAEEQLNDLWIQRSSRYIENWYFYK